MATQRKKLEDHNRHNELTGCVAGAMPERRNTARECRFQYPPRQKSHERPNRKLTNVHLVSLILKRHLILFPPSA